MIGVDLVDVERFRAVMARSPGVARRYFSAAERDYCASHADPVLHLAATFAAKEAAMKALGAVPAVAYARRIEIRRAASGAPYASYDGKTLAVSISHDRDTVVAVALG